MGGRELLKVGFPFRAMGVFQKDIEVVVTQHCECTKCRQILHFKMLPFVM